MKWFLAAKMLVLTALLVLIGAAFMDIQTAKNIDQMQIAVESFTAYLIIGAVALYSVTLSDHSWFLKYREAEAKNNTAMQWTKTPTQ